MMLRMVSRRYTESDALQQDLPMYVRNKWGRTWREIVGVLEREPCIGWSCTRAIDICEADTECITAIQRASGV
jgi:hypothetical protein